MNFDLSKREFRDALRLRYDWPIPDSPSVCVCGCSFTVDHAMICQRGCLIIQRHNEIRDLEADLLDMVCYDVAIEPTLQPLAGEELNRGANTAPDARLDVHCRGFWERQGAAFFDIRVCHPNADSYKELSPKQIYKLHEDEKKRKNNRSRECHIYALGFHHNRRYVSGVSAVPLQACRAHLFKAGGLRNNNRMDQNEGVLCHTADCPSLFEGNKVTEKKDKFTRE